MNKPFLLASFITGLTLFIASYVLSSFGYFKRNQVKYRMRKMFPYEFNYPNTFKNNVYGNILFILGSALITGFYVTFYNSDVFPKSATGIASIVISIVLTMLFICLLLMPLQYLKTHAVLSIFMMTFAVILPLLNFFIGFQSFQSHRTNNLAYHFDIVSMVVSLLLSLSMLLFVVNPKSTLKIYMDKALDSEGKEVFIRPRIIYLALNEWLAIITFVVSPLGLLFLLF